MSAIFKNLPGRWPVGHTPKPTADEHFEKHGCDSSLHPGDCLANWPAPVTPPLPRVVGTIDARRNLPHMTILRVQTGAAAQIINDGDAHHLSYAGSDLVDYLDMESLNWDRESLDSLRRMLPAVIVDMPA
jgi:hypothetical protein